MVILNRTNTGFWAVTIAAWLLSIVHTNTFAATASEKHIKSHPSLIELEKVTVGPYDNFQVTARPDESEIFFVRRVDLTSQIYSQKLPGFDAKPFVLAAGDSQQPELSPDGAQLVYLSFERRSLGEVCLTPTTEFKPRCLELNLRTSAGDSLSSGQLSSPFWLSKNQVGLLVRDVRTGATHIVAVQLDASKASVPEILATGAIWSPTASQNGRWISYIAASTPQEREILILDRQAQKSYRVQNHLPGRPGFSAFSADSRHLYFSHYFSDTNGDQSIDGNDNSVILRVSLERLKDSVDLTPEQITSLSTNCNFPRPKNQSLYVSCAFEGALNIYRLPLTGVVPNEWTKDQLLDAYQTARTYGDRLLLLSVLHQRWGWLNSSDYLTQMMGHHLLAEDYSAASHYARILLQASASMRPKVDTGDLIATRIFSDLWAVMGRSPDQIPSGEIRKKIEILSNESKDSKISGFLRQVLQLRAMAFLDKRLESAKLAKKLQWPPSVSLLGGYLTFHTLRDLFRELGPNSPEVQGLYARMIQSSEAQDEARLFFAFEWLSLNQRANLQPEARKRSLSEFEKLIQNPVVKKLFEVESHALDIMTAQGDAKTPIYGKLTRLLNENQKSYFLARAMYVRSILTFADAGEFQYLDFVASNWVRYTSKASTEYLQAIRQFKSASLSRAYETYAKKDWQRSSSYFYGALSIIDDLESHFGFIDTKLQLQQRKTLDERYAFLAKDGYAVESQKYVRAVLSLLDFHPDQPDTIKSLDQAIESLESMKDYINDPSRRLLLGSCYLDKTLLNSQGLEIDRVSFDRANFHLMLATDLGQDNDRILASAFENLGVLHQRALNHGVAVEFFKKRNRLGFLTDQDAWELAYLLSKSHFFLGQYSEATESLERVEKKVPTEYKPLWLERMAFYALAREDYANAEKYYLALGQTTVGGKLLETPELLLATAVAMFHNKKNQQAQSRLEKIRALTTEPEKVSKGERATLGLPHSRIRLLASGYLSFVTSQAGLQARYLNSYNEELDLAKKRLADVGLRLDAWLKYKITANLRRLSIETISARRAEIYIEVTEQLEDYIQETGQALSGLVPDTISTVLGESISAGDSLPSKAQGRLTGSAQKFHRAVDMQPFSPVLAKQKLRLLIYQTAQESKNWAAIQEHPWMKRLTQVDPKSQAHLQELIGALQ